MYLQTFGEPIDSPVAFRPQVNPVLTNSQYQSLRQRYALFWSKDGTTVQDRIRILVEAFADKPGHSLSELSARIMQVIQPGIRIAQAAKDLETRLSKGH